MHVYCILLYWLVLTYMFRAVAIIQKYRYYLLSQTHGVTSVVTQEGYTQTDDGYVVVYPLVDEFEIHGVGSGLG